MKKKLISALLIAVVFCALIIPADAAVYNPITVMPKNMEQLPIVGETLEFIIVPNESFSFKSLFISPVYDEEIFELVSCEWNYENPLLSDVDLEKGNAVIAFSSEVLYKNDGFYFKLKIRDDAVIGETSVSVDLKRQLSGGDNYYNDVLVTKISVLPRDISFSDDSQVYVTEECAIISGKRTAGELLSCTESENAVIYDRDGEIVASDSVLSTGMVIEAAYTGNFVYAPDVCLEESAYILRKEVVVLGDADCSAGVDASDARTALRKSVDLDELTESALLAADVDNDGDVTSADARSILRASVDLDDPAEWLYLRIGRTETDPLLPQIRI